MPEPSRCGRPLCQNGTTMRSTYTAASRQGDISLGSMTILRQDKWRATAPE